MAREKNQPKVELVTLSVENDLAKIWSVENSEKLIFVSPFQAC